MAEENPFRALRPAPAAAENPFRALRPQPMPEQEPDQESDRGVLEEIARGTGAGLLGIPQGIAELGAMGIDYAFDTDTSAATTEFFENAKTRLGLDPETTAGKAAEGISNFAGAFIPVAGWLGRAGQAAKGAKALGKTGAFTRSAERFGASDLGKALVGSRARLAGTTTLAGGVSDFFVSPEGTGTLLDAFDAVPENLQTEEESGLTGRDEAARRLRNKLRVGAEGALMGGLFEAAFPVLRGTAVGVANAPGVPALARTLNRGLEAIGSRLAGVDKLQNLFTARGVRPQEIFEALETTDATVTTLQREAESSLMEFDAAAKKVAGNMFTGRIKGGGRAGLDKAYDDLLRYLQGSDEALESYGNDVLKPARQMRDQISRMSTTIAEQIKNSGLDAQTKKDLLGEFEKNAGSYVRRLYRRFEDPDFYVDEKTLRSPLYKQAIDEVQGIMQRMDEGAVRRGELQQVRVGDELRAAAEQQVKKQLGLDVLDRNLDPAAAARIQGQQVKKGRSQIQKEGQPLHELAEGLLAPRSRFMDESPALRELMGEIKDPRRAYLRTVEDMAKFVATNRLYQDVGQRFGQDYTQAISAMNRGGRPMVIQNVPSAEAAQQLSELGYKQLGAQAQNSLFGGSYGSLTGSWVAPEVYASLTMPTRMTQGFLNETLALSLQAKGAAQAAKTVYSPITQVRNFISGVFLTMANGNVMRNMDFSDSFRLTAGKAANLADDEFRRLFEMTGSLGLREQNITVNEFRELLKEGSNLTVSGKVQGGLQKAKDRIPFANSLERLYSNSDTFWKLVNWNAERAKYAAAFRKAGLSPESANLNAFADDLVRAGLGSRTSELSGTADYLDILASDIVKNTTPNYSRVPEAVKAIRRIPFVGNFVAFPAEVIRNTSNILNQGLKEMGFSAQALVDAGRLTPQQARQLERQIRGIGAQRLSGYVASAMVIPTGIQMTAKEILGYDDEQMEDLQKLAPYYMKGHQLVPLSRPENGDVEYIDLSYMMPYDFAMAPARAALQLYSEKGAVGASEATQLREAAFAGLGKLFEPFAGESLIGERLLNVTARGGRTPLGAELYTQNTPFGEKMKIGFNHIAGAFVPGAAELFMQERRGDFVAGRLPRSLTGTPSATGQVYRPYEEGAALVSGLRSMRTRLDETFSYKGFEYNQARRDATSVFSRVVNANDTTEQDILEAYNKANEQLMVGQAQLYDLVQSAKRLGMSDRDIRQQLTEVARLGRKEVSKIMRGQFDPLNVSDDRVKTVLREGREQARVTKRLPVGELKAIERTLMREPLPNVAFDAEQARTQETIEQVPGVPSTNPFAALRAPAPDTGVVPTPAPVQAPATRQAPPQELLGGNLIDRLRNMEIFQRQQQ